MTLPAATIGGIDHFVPHTIAGPRWHCNSFDGVVYVGSAAQYQRGGIRAMPAQGCSFFIREPGADDEPGPPISYPLVGTGTCRIDGKRRHDDQQAHQ